uniref:Nucleoside diphosphate kinase-like domain-containing protein n=1 Tax=Chromera velia CCMP2878 TaxID=1169474 RepID=A0A0G4I8L0_9ALVE|mmetsp:Transcript_49752/g.98043  ORF Transcript_49752/g.98043 Transcript_49752/m.98043 type:complete len:307 (-) Transcript_49752:622-1542(-)|eukprot:Cvel_1981.t1-p1 / transcript=Cvel_1981.t1 / gene=Cvel_1981 / organism=Chromera_velia_CCMP2878 / gene_product=hypothetical protein / transcript_product=hypothetical protein / location=Cvel_scaffold75:77495-80494(-) / protein_length=306 / sequence_SO=supercontig / SO=protein_coding / is_pseudo=false
MVKNSAFVFIKPHAVTDKTIALVKSELEAKNFTIKKEGSLGAAEIDEKKLIDQHYYAIASKATLLKPDQLNVPADKFEAKFGIPWKDALAQGKVFNALDGCKELGITADQLDAKWGAAKKADKLIKFGGGFYCGDVEGKFIFNGFFMSMRSKFVAPGTSIYYFVVEWESKTMAWEAFRGEFLGPTDPEQAPKESLRGQILANWEALGLQAKPNTGDNGVHASASPFEALAERLNWLGCSLAEDDFGKALLEAGIPKETIEAWSVDPQVTYGAPSMPIKASLFDTLEDTDSDHCAAKCMMVHLTAKK